MSLDYTRKERGLLGEPSRVGAVQISIRKASRERRGGHACKITKWKVKQSLEQKHKRMLESMKKLSLEEYKEEIDQKIQIRFI